MMTGSIDFEWNNGARQSLDELLANARASSGGAVAVFDFDNTLVLRDCGEAFLAYTAEKRLLRDPAQNVFPLLPQESVKRLEYLWESGSREFPGEFLSAYLKLVSLDTRKAYFMAAAAASGYAPSEIQPIIQDATAFMLDAPMKRAEFPLTSGASLPWWMTIRPYAPMKKLVADLAGAGVQVMVLSASFEDVVRVAAQQLFGIGSAQVHGVRLKTDERGLYLNEPGRTVTWKEGKVEVLDALLAPGRNIIFAAGDSTSDFPVLERAQTALFLAYPGREDAARKAAAAGFVVQELKF